MTKKIAIPGQFSVAYAEARYEQLTNCLQEQTEQGKIEILLRWGIAEDKILRACRKAFDPKNTPARLNTNRVEYELSKNYYNKIKRTMIQI